MYFSSTNSFAVDFSRRYAKLLPGPFRNESTSLALAILASGTKESKAAPDTLTDHDWTRLEAYSKNLVDHHLIIDLLPRLAELYFFAPQAQRLTLSPLQQALLLGMGLQMKTADKLSVELNLPVNQILAMLNKAIRRFSKSPSTTTAAGEESTEFESAVKALPSDKLKSGVVVSIPSSEDKAAAMEQEATAKSGVKRPSDTPKKHTQPKQFQRRSDKKHKRG